MTGPPAPERGRSRAHAMPFGAEVRSDGTVRFRLWAPDARRIRLRLGAAERRVDLDRADDGWWEGTEAAPAGTPYRYEVDDGLLVPDPASRAQQDDVHGPSLVVDPRAYAWGDADWRGRPWEETVLYEVHVGAFTPEGTFRAAIARLDALADLGVTAVELMPVADFPGRRSWGYDGVLPYAPDRTYGVPDDLKALVEAAHARGLMVFLDVVYNHFGPDGNYLWRYARPFFTDRHPTPWGAAIDFEGPRRRTVRDFFVHNALYWLEEYALDGLRIDSVHAIHDETAPSFLEELAQAAHAGPGRERAVHLVIENDHNETRWLRRDDRGAPRLYVAQWDDDVHHALHVALTGEATGPYGDFADAPLDHLARALAEGFAWQGEPSPFRGGRPRGEPTHGLPPTAFVAFLQNHDQVGNRPLGERLSVLASERAVHAAVALLLLSPLVPLLFMGEEIGSERPFPFFCDFEGDLARAVAEGRRQELARWPGLDAPAARARIPDPNAEATFGSAVLASVQPRTDGPARWRERYRHLLALRRGEVVPRLLAIEPGTARTRRAGSGGLEVVWPFSDGGALTLRTNLGQDAVAFPDRPAGPALYASDPASDGVHLPGSTTAWYLDPGPVRASATSRRDAT